MMDVAVYMNIYILLPELLPIFRMMFSFDYKRDCIKRSQAGYWIFQVRFNWVSVFVL